MTDVNNLHLENEKKAEFRQWIKDNRKKSKLNFIDFVNFYNEHKLEIGLNPNEEQALRDLHGMWKRANKVYDVDFYFDMKNYHSMLNGTLLENSIWKTYIENVTIFRVSLMRRATMHALPDF